MLRVRILFFVVEEMDDCFTISDNKLDMDKMRGAGLVISKMRGCDLRGYICGVIGKMRGRLRGYSKHVLYGSVISQKV